MRLANIVVIVCLLAGCASSPSEKEISTVFKAHLEREGYYALTSMRVISVEQIAGEPQVVRQDPKRKAYVVNVIFSVDARKDVSRGFFLLHRQGEHVDCEGSFALLKKDGRWAVEPIKFDKKL